MKRWRVAGIVLSIACGLVIWFVIDLHLKRNHKEADIQSFDSQIATLRRELPVGTTRTEVDSYLKRHSLGSLDQLTFNLRLQTITSTELYCSRWGGYATFRFSQDGEKLVEVGDEIRGEDCL